MLRTYKRVAGVVCAASMGVACQGEDYQEEFEDVAAVTQEIKNGNVGYHPGVVAVYTGFVRPCSGVYLTANGVSWVLTARHCLTTDGSISGPLISAGSVWVTSLSNPGLTPPSLAWRASASTPYWRSASQIRQRNTSTDLALLRLNGVLTMPNGAAMWPSFPGGSSPATFVNSEIECAGYGRAFNLGLPGNHEDGTTGAGTARWARFTVSSANSNLITFPINSADQVIASGDSGGPCWFVHSQGKTLIGINHSSPPTIHNPTSGTAVTVTGNTNASWVMNTINN